MDPSKFNVGKSENISHPNPADFDQSSPLDKKISDVAQRELSNQETSEGHAMSQVSGTVGQKGTVAKVGNLGINILSSGKLSSDIAKRKNSVENGIIPNVPIAPIQPTNIEDRMKDLQIPGASIAIINNGEIEWAAGYGELQDCTMPIQAASISKTVAALTTLSLIDQCQQAAKEGRPSGLVDDKMITLDTDVSTLLDEDLWKSIDPEGITSGDHPKMTVRHLLSHTAGTLVDHFDGYPRLEEISKEIEVARDQIENLSPEQGDLGEKLRNRLLKLEETLSKAREEEDLPDVDAILMGRGNSEKAEIKHVPGTEFHYSGAGSMILQKIITNLTGKSYEEVVFDRVFSKVGMHNSTYHPDESRIPKGHDKDASPIIGSSHRYPELAAAGLWTTPVDLAKMAIGIQRSLSGEGVGIISQDLANEMIRPQLKDTDHGLGIFLTGGATSKYFFHEGANDGFNCCMVANDKGQGAVIMTNSDVGKSLYDEAFKSVAEVYNWSDKAEIPMLKDFLSSDEIKEINAAVPIDFSKWTARLGSYQAGESTLTFSESNGKIFIQDIDTDSYEITPLTDTLAIIKEDPSKVLRFVQVDNDSQESLSAFGVEYKKLPSS